MEAYSILIWKIIGAIAVLWVAQKLLAMFNAPVLTNQPVATATTSNIPVTTANSQIKPNSSVVKPNQPPEKVIINNIPTKVATPEKKEVFSKDSKDRERNLEERKRALTEKARNNMLNSLNEKNQAQEKPVASNMAFPSPVNTPVRNLPINSPNHTSPKASSPTVGELCNPVPLDQQLLNSNLSKSTPSASVNRPSVEEKKPAKPLSQSQSPNSRRKEKPAEEGLCLQTGEIKTISAKTSIEEDRETKRRRAIEAFELNKNKNL